MYNFKVGDKVKVNYGLVPFVAEVCGCQGEYISIMHEDGTVDAFHCDHLELMETSVKKQWVDVIHAWADGKAIQYSGIVKGDWPGWFDFEPNDQVPAFFSPLTKWRIKPETITKRYRMALIGNEVIAIDVTDGATPVPDNFNSWVGDAINVIMEAQ